MLDGANSFLTHRPNPGEATNSHIVLDTAFLVGVEKVFSQGRRGDGVEINGSRFHVRQARDNEVAAISADAGQQHGDDAGHQGGRDDCIGGITACCENGVAGFRFLRLSHHEPSRPVVVADGSEWGETRCQ
jgi:hypothetical protein